MPLFGIVVVIYLAKFDSEIQLMIIDVNGRVVANLFNGTAVKNTPYSIEFNSGNLQAGIYFARLIGSNGESAYSRILLVR